MRVDRRCWSLLDWSAGGPIVRCPDTDTDTDTDTGELPEPHAPSALLELSSLDPGLGARAQGEWRAASIARGSRRTRTGKRSGWDYASTGHLACLVQACVKGARDPYVCMHACMHTRRSASSDKFYGAVCRDGLGQASSQRKQRKQTQSRPLLWSRHTSAAPWVSGAPASDFWTTKVRLPAPVAPPGWPSMSGARGGASLFCRRGAAGDTYLLTYLLVISLTWHTTIASTGCKLAVDLLGYQSTKVAAVGVVFG